MKKVKLSLIILISLLILACPNPTDNPINNLIDNPIDETVLTKFGDVITGAPCYVNIMFQAKDFDGTPISDLTADDFSIMEEGSAVSPTEAALRIRKQDAIPYTLYTVLMLDNSMSVGTNITDIKAAAKELINIADNKDAASRDGSTGNQKFMIYSFYGTIDEQTSGFTNDVSTLLAAIDSIPMGGSSTNLYGAVELGVSKWTDVYSITKIEQGFLVLLTDGSDEADISSLSSAKSARGDKKVITIGIGDELDTSVMEDLGNAGFYQISDYSELTSKFIEIQTSMQEFANSFYWLDYLSPKRGDKDRTLSLSIDSERYPKSNELTGTFSTADFYDVLPGVYANADSENHDGINSFAISMGETYTINLNTYFGSAISPVYEFTSDCGETKVEITQSEINSSVFTVECLAFDGSCTFTIKDTTSNYTKNITCSIEPRFTITYEANEADSGEVPTSSAYVLTGEGITLEGNNGTLSKDNLFFQCWNTEPDGSGINYYVGDTFIIGTSDAVLYAKWFIPLNRDFVFIEGGTFTQEIGFDHTISDFSIGKYEVTYEIWYTVYQWARSNGYSFSKSGKEGQDGISGRAPTSGKYEPVTNINWREAIVWCNAYSEMNGRTPVYENTSGNIIKDSRDSNGTECDSTVPNWNANGYRLPTEGEWLFAAKGGNSSNGYIYSGSDNSYDVAWYHYNSANDTHEVGGLQPNELGLYDMSGNVREWCYDLYSSSFPSESTDYRGAFYNNGLRVVRDGAWDYGGFNLSSRDYEFPYDESPSYGLRLAHY